MEDKIIELAYALDTFYFLVMGAFVMWMAAGFTMLESGLVRAKNTAEILTKNIALYSIAVIMYMIVGYNLMYPATGTGIIPGLSFFLGADHATDAVIASGGDIYYSGIADHFFQVVFVATACSIISGAVAERMKLWPFLLFCVFMTSIIYPVQGYWKWGGGFLDEAGFSDFAGSGVVHLCGAAAALAGVMVLGARTGKYTDGKVNAMPGANLPLATLGTFILWLGWFGFNGGSELIISNVSEANAVSMILVNTNLAAAGGVMGALILSKMMFGKSDLTMALNGAIGGLVSITAEPLAPTPGLALVVGFIGGLIVVFSIIGLDKLRIDDPVGAISAHGTCGIWGLLAVSLTSGSFGTQLYGTIVIFLWTFIVSYLFWSAINMIYGLRVNANQEDEGVDIAECGLEAYPEFSKSMDSAPSVYPKK
ncbi:MAG: ammonium transporter [Gammaproteobacteria bacterium]|nr:ammonium transporter [Gammaproteobacteria bacterium]|tara:strand:- start:31710 stop:32978 length:1269 start_codon:yes stop_codon:yes gene_type:complete